MWEKNDELWLRDRSTDTKQQFLFSLFHNSWRRRSHSRAVPGSSSSFCIFALDKFFASFCSVFWNTQNLRLFLVCWLWLSMAKGGGRREAATTTSDNDKHVKKREKMWQGGRKMWGKHSHIAIVVFRGEYMEETGMRIMFRKKSLNYKIYVQSRMESEQ